MTSSTITELLVRNKYTRLVMGPAFWVTDGETSWRPEVRPWRLPPSSFFFVGLPDVVETDPQSLFESL